MNNTIESFTEFIIHSTLDDREKFVLCMRLGGFTLKEIGEEMKPRRELVGKKVDGKLDPQRVRQIEARAIRRLRIRYYHLTKEAK